MKVFVPHGVTCFSGTTFVCISQFENWQAVLIAAGKRAYPGRNPDTMIYHTFHSAFEEVSSLHDPITKHFILADLEEQECARTVVFAVFTSSYEFFGACHWTQVTQVWDILDLCGGEKGWVVYHNNQRLRHHKVPVHHGNDSVMIATPPFELIALGMIVPWNGLSMLQHQYIVKLLNLLCQHHQFLILPAMIATMIAPHSSKQGIPCY